MQTKHEVCNSLLGFQGTSRARPLEAAAVPGGHLWNMDVVQPGQAQALGEGNGLVALPPHLHRAWGSCLEPCLSQTQLPGTKDF